MLLLFQKHKGTIYRVHKTLKVQCRIIYNKIQIILYYVITDKLNEGHFGFFHGS